MFSDEEVNKYLEGYKPIENDVTFAEVRLALERARSAKAFVPPHVIKTIALFEDAYEFAQDHKLSLIRVKHK